MLVGGLWSVYYYIAALLRVGIRIQKAERGGWYALAFVIS